MFPNKVAAFPQRFRNRNAILVCDHAADQRIAVSVMLVNVKLHSCDGIAIQVVCLGQP